MSRSYPYNYQKMASTHQDDAPELVPQNFPEVVQAPQYHYQPSQYQYAQPPLGTPVKSPDPSYVTTGYGSVIEPAPYLAQPSGVDAQSAAHQDLAMEKGGRKRVVCGCSLIVFILSCIIGVLAAAVIGLAAGTGVEANRAATAEAQVEELKSSLASAGPTATTTSASATATADTWDDVTNNCSSNGDSVTSSTYTTQFFNKVTFTMYCNRDTPHAPIMSLFVADFNTCMDACASYTSYTNTTCAAVSFAPAWANKTTAVAGSAPGDCYLKPGPQNRTALTDVNAGTEVHSAVLLTDD